MKSITTVLFSVMLVCCTLISTAQTADTIYTIRNDKIACKVHEIGQVEIKYKKLENPDGPFYTVLRERVRGIKYANGYEEMILPDEMDVHKEEPIMHKRSLVKMELFSPLFDQVSVGYEHVLRPGINVEVKLGFINNSMFPFSFSNTGNAPDQNLIQGGFVKAGIKLLLGSHTYTPGTKYRHPLYGSYFQFSIGQTIFIERNLEYPYYYWWPPYYYPSSSVITDKQVGATTFTVAYGHQFILANTFTLGMSVGVGYSISYSKYTNPAVYEIINTYHHGEDRYDIPNNMYSHVTAGGRGLPLCFNGSFSLGYILK